MTYTKIFAFLILLSTVAFGQFTDFHPELNWFTIRGKNCVVHFHEGAERTAQTVLKIGDEIWEPITTLYEYEPETVHYVIKDIDDYSNGATYFFDNKIEIWSSALDFELRGFHNWLRNVISHEFTHMVQIQASLKTKRTLPAFYLQWLNYEDERRPDILYGFPNIIVSYPIGMVNMPAWFAEGTAQYMRKEFDYDRWDSHRDMILRSYALENKLLTWPQMGVFEKTSLGNESVYNSGFALTRYIAQKYGEDKLRKLTKALGKLTVFTFDGACKDVLGITGTELYDEWAAYLKADYAKRTAPIRATTIQGKEIVKDGFGNFYPFFFEKNKILYISNSGEDYLGKTDLYAINPETGTTEKIRDGVRSTVSRVPGTSTVLYAKLTEDNPGWVNVHDIFSYDIVKDKEKRLTNNLRATQPSVSPKGDKIVFTSQKDGTGNICITDIEGKNFLRLTDFQNGEQVFNPVFAPDGKTIAFDFAFRHNRDIIMMNSDGTAYTSVLSSESDERNPFFENDSTILYSADYTGIYNIYRLHLKTGEKTQITNVLGGAFMPASDSTGNIVYAGYTAGGYKLFYLRREEQSKIPDDHAYKVVSNPPLNQNTPNGDAQADVMDRLKNYNDMQVPPVPSEKYSGAFSRLSFFPVLRVDNYNTTNNDLQKIKPGVYFTSSDMLNRYGVFGGVSLNSRLERDLFLSFDFRNKLPLLFNLGIKPELTLELFNISRKTNVDVEIEELGSTKTDVTYNLFEVGFSAKHRVFARGNDITLKYSYSRYSAALGSFVVPGTSLFSPEFSDPYLIAGNIGFSYNLEGEAPYIDADINPKGFDLELKYNYEMNKFNPDGKYDFEDGILKSLYDMYYFHRLEIHSTMGFAPVPGHVLSMKMRAGTIFGPEVPDFFDFYLGGLVGMKSYPFYAVSGNEIAWINITYRFPLWKNIDAKAGHLYIDKIFLSVFGDFGNAWNGNKPRIDDFKKGAGTELRFAMNSFYLFPTSLFFNASYGFDTFQRKTRMNTTVTYGGEFRFYGGVLFSFDF